MVAIRRLAVGLVVVVVASVLAAAAGIADGATVVRAAPVGSVRADFDDDGFVDLAIGVSGEDIGMIGSAGAVIALYGSASGLSTTGAQFLIQAGGATELNDAFGAPLAAEDFNGDGFADLAAGTPDP